VHVGNNGIIWQSRPRGPEIVAMLLSATWHLVHYVYPNFSFIVIADRKIRICVTTGNGDLVVLLEFKHISCSNR
jgi:hypothetical protein